MDADILRINSNQWMRDALCTQIGDDLFFSEGVGDHSARTAKKICRGCPVVSECLEYALRNNLAEHGVFGGRTAKERRTILKARKAEKAAVS